MRQYGGLAQKLPWVATMFFLVTLSIIGLPMLNSFVGEFLVLTGSMQSTLAHHQMWTAIAATGVVLSAAYMLRMVQRVFYCDVGPKPQAVAGWDLDAREHLALWPMVALFLAMGLFSPLWMRAIDGAAIQMADHPASVHATLPNRILTIEAETYRPASSSAPQTTSPQTASGGAHR
jgi:NADH-quinone oxidoreductase subunit M